MLNELLELLLFVIAVIMFVGVAGLLVFICYQLDRIGNKIFPEFTIKFKKLIGVL